MEFGVPAPHYFRGKVAMPSRGIINSHGENLVDHINHILPYCESMVFYWIFMVFSGTYWLQGRENLVLMSKSV